MLDGRLTIAELLTQATTVVGPSGPGRLARLIAGLGERGMLDGIAPTPVAEPEPGLLARAFKPREKTFDWVPDYFERAYRHWGRIFFSPLTVTLLVLLSVARARGVRLSGRRPLRDAAGGGAPAAPRRCGVHRRALPAS